MKRLYFAACLIYFWLFNSITLISISLLLGITISNVHFWVSIFITIILFSRFIREELTYKDFISIILLGVLITLFFIGFASHLYTDVWDSNSYHKQAVGLLYYGWNPVYQSSWDFETVAHTTQLYSPSLTWSEVYPKATWYFSAMLYKITGNIESGKIFTMISMLMLFVLGFDYLFEKGYGKIRSAVVAVFIAFNPIPLSQFRSFYLDGFACNILLIIMLEMIIIEDRCYKKDKKNNWYLLVLSVAIGCALKTSIVMFNIIICATYFIYKLITNIVLKKPLLNSLLIGLPLFFAGLIGVVIIGFSPYITNIARYHNFSYKSEELMEYLFPFKAGLVDCESNFQAFFVSIFSKMDSREYTTIKETVKIPFSIHPNEIAHYSLADTIKGGMGIWFSGLLILSLIIIFRYLLFCRRKRKSIENRFALLLIAVIFIAVSITPLTYWHRYIGFIYIIPIVAVLSLLIHGQFKKNDFILFLTIFTAYVNIAPWFLYTVKDIQKSVVTEAQLMGMSNRSKDGMKYEVALASDEFVGILYNLKDWNIDYIYLDKLDNDSQRDIMYTYYMYYREAKD